eukprot:gene25726-11384_t
MGAAGEHANGQATSEGVSVASLPSRNMGRALSEKPVYSARPKGSSWLRYRDAMPDLELLTQAGRMSTTQTFPRAFPHSSSSISLDGHTWQDSMLDASVLAAVAAGTSSTPLLDDSECEGVGKSERIDKDRDQEAGPRSSVAVKERNSSHNGRCKMSWLHVNDAMTSFDMLSQLQQSQGFQNRRQPPRRSASTDGKVPMLGSRGPSRHVLLTTDSSLLAVNPRVSVSGSERQVTRSSMNASPIHGSSVMSSLFCDGDEVNPVYERDGSTYATSSGAPSMNPSSPHRGVSSVGSDCFETAAADTHSRQRDHSGSDMSNSSQQLSHQAEEDGADKGSRKKDGALQALTQRIAYSMSRHWRHVKEDVLAKSLTHVKENVLVKSPAPPGETGQLSGSKLTQSHDTTSPVLRPKMSTTMSTTLSPRPPHRDQVKASYSRSTAPGAIYPGGEKAIDVAHPPLTPPAHVIKSPRVTNPRIRASSALLHERGGPGYGGVQGGEGGVCLRYDNCVESHVGLREGRSLPIIAATSSSQGPQYSSTDVGRAAHASAVLGSGGAGHMQGNLALRASLSSRKPQVALPPCGM